jgi:hypothetical protein
MKNLMAPNIPLAIVLLAAVAAVALRAAARRLEPPQAPGTGPAPVMVMAGHSRSQPQTAVTTGTQDGTRVGTAMPPAPLDRPASAADQVQHIFHELHANGRNAFCAVCDSQYGSA